MIVSDESKFNSNSIFFVLAGLIVSLIAIHVNKTRSLFYQLGNKIPGPPTLPLIGNAHLTLGKNHNQILEEALRYSEIYGDVVRGWLGYKLVVFLMNPSDVGVILESSNHLDKSDEYRFFKPWLGDGLLISSGDLWRRHRKMIAPTFHQNILKSFVGTFYDHSCRVVDAMKKEIDKEFDVHDYMSKTTVDILLETAMGTKDLVKDDEGYKYAKSVMDMCYIIHKRQYNPFLRLDFFYKFTNMKKQQENLLNTIHRLTEAVVDYKKKMLNLNHEENSFVTEVVTNSLAKHQPKTVTEKNSQAYRDDLDEIDNEIGEKRRLAFLDLMIEAAKSGANLTDDEIKDEVNTIMFEGHDTTAAASSFCLCLLGIHQHIQDKVMTELKSIFGDSDRPPNFSDTLEMRYLERVIMETLRMYPPVPIIARKMNEDVKIVSENIIIPKDTTVVIGTYKIHRRPDIYPNPDTFDPDNFLPERTQGRHYYSFIPFSAGPRSCVGRKYAMLKLKVLLSTILRRYHIISDVKESDFKLQGDIILKRTDGFRIKIKERQ